PLTQPGLHVLLVQIEGSRQAERKQDKRRGERAPGRFELLIHKVLLTYHRRTRHCEGSPSGPPPPPRRFAVHREAASIYDSSGHLLMIRRSRTRPRLPALLGGPLSLRRRRRS